MEIFAWLWWLISTILGGALALLWFLVSGWVSTLLQFAVLVVVIYFLKYGWQKAPVEIWRRTRSFARFFFNWLGGREPHATEPQTTVHVVRVKELGDINVSTLLSLLVLVGLILASQL